MKTKPLAAALLAPATIVGLASCTSASKLCTVRHRYAIVIFQNGLGNVGKTVVSRFRLNVRYGPSDVRHWLIQAHITLGEVRGHSPGLIVRTYPVGNATSCSIDDVRARP